MKNLERPLYFFLGLEKTMTPFAGSNFPELEPSTKKNFSKKKFSYFGIKQLKQVISLEVRTFFEKSYWFKIFSNTWFYTLEDAYSKNQKIISI